VLAKYGGICRCCNIADHFALTVDHVRNDGKADRLSVSSPATLMRRILRQKLQPHRYQILCWNCNEAKRIYGRCPHKAAKRRSA
jgi:hypothetical protein